MTQDQDDFIMFQPTFIYEFNYNNQLLALITKCDSLIRFDHQLILIETKGTSSTKRVHFLDLFTINIKY